MHFRDLLHQKIDTFNANMEKTLENTKTLTNQMHTIRITHADMPHGDTSDRKKILHTYFDKVDKLISAADQIKMRFISLKEDKDRLTDKAQNIDYMGNLIEL